MGFISSLVSPPKVKIPQAPPAANPPTMANASVANSGDLARARARAAAGMGFSDTIQNQGGPAGLKLGGTAGKSLLG